jgi:hypothetical protein
LRQSWGRRFRCSILQQNIADLRTKGSNKR